MAERLNFNGMTAVITGAASGIGEALAEALAARGANLALADINEDGVKAVAHRLKSNQIKITAQVLDVADRDAPAAFAANVTRDHGGAALVFNNAGIAVGGEFERVAEADFDRVLEVNFHGVVRMSRAFLPLLKAQPAGQLVNVSSLFGIIAPPGQTAYSASKFAVRGFSMALAHELEGTSVGVSVVHPGGVNTRIAESAKIPADATPEEIETQLAAAKAALVMPPPRAAQIILDGVERRQRRIVVGNDARLAILFERIFPVSYLRFMRRRLG
jgi:NAD(P)-dependent dehydrogenase (short-subunit alcohol dehydrogenase family)